MKAVHSRDHLISEQVSDCGLNFRRKLGWGIPSFLVLPEYYLRNAGCFYKEKQAWRLTKICRAFHQI